MGIPDENIILMNSLEIACDPRNTQYGSVCGDMNYQGDLINEMYQNVQFDYTGNEVTIDTFSRLLTDRHYDHSYYKHKDMICSSSSSFSFPSSSISLHKRLQSDENSNILIFMSGHGGDEFFKFQDQQELSAEDLGYLFHEMYLKKRYKEIIFIIDTCQASTIANYITSPNIITIASSAKDENSYSYVNSDTIGTSFIDRFTYSIQLFFNQYRQQQPSQKNNEKNSDKVTNHINPSKYVLNRNVTFQHLLDSFDSRFLRSTVTVIPASATASSLAIDNHNYPSRTLSEIPLVNFFSVASIDENEGDDQGDIEIIDMIINDSDNNHHNDA